MFLFLSKVLPPLVMPVGLCLELLLLGAVLVYTSRRRLALGVLVLAGLALGVPALPVCTNALVGPLERQYPLRSSAATAGADAIVVLGGGTSGRPAPEAEVELASSGNRLLHAYRLFRAGKARLLILSGGLTLPGQSEAEQMRQILGEWGVPAGAMVLEDRSQNTHENATATAALACRLGLHRLLLVTSAVHMPRSMALFRHAGEQCGLEIIAAPTGASTPIRHAFALSGFLPDAGALVLSTLALRERLGLWIYRRRGWL